MLRIAPYLYVPVTDMPGDFEVSFYAVLRGFHVYQAVWTPTVGEALATQREHSNPEDAYAAAVTQPRSNYKRQFYWRLALYLEQKKYDTMPSGA